MFKFGVDSLPNAQQTPKWSLGGGSESMKSNASFGSKAFFAIRQIEEMSADEDSPGIVGSIY